MVANPAGTLAKAPIELAVGHVAGQDEVALDAAEGRACRQHAAVRQGQGGIPLAATVTDFLQLRMAAVAMDVRTAVDVDFQ
ncbi:hypothetical protein D3C84_1102570 [compost metagenome]